MGFLRSEFSPEEQQVIAEFTGTEGYYGLSHEDDPPRQAFLQHPADYIAEVEALKTQQAENATADPYLSENKKMLLERVSQAIRNAGAEPVFIESPALHVANDLRSAQQLGVIHSLLSYKDPNRFPELYANAYRHDMDHLNDAESREWTQRVAEDFTELIVRAIGR